ncbi:MAG: T9SS type A sorting domain-containing protein [Saprospiraceae bacterium]|nr:T9SS type A sorting domain-containing protein [Saprospiraceae bacterium]
MQHEQAEIHIFSSLGTKVFSNLVTEKRTVISVKGLPNGMYFINLNKKGVFSRSQKLIIIDN